MLTADEIEKIRKEAKETLSPSATWQELVDASINLTEQALLTHLQEQTDEEMVNLLFTFHHLEAWNKATNGDGGLLEALTRYAESVLSHISPILKAQKEKARQEERLAIGQALYDLLPSGEISAFDLIKLLNKVIQKLQDGQALNS